MRKVWVVLGALLVLGFVSLAEDGSVVWPSTPENGFAPEPQVICDPKGGGTYCYVICTKECGGMDWECYGLCAVGCLLTSALNPWALAACLAYCAASCYTPPYCCEGYIQCRTISPCPE